MLELAQINDELQVLDNGDEASRRQAIHSLKQFEEQEWAEAPPKVIQSLVKALKNHWRAAKQPSIRQEVATILGRMGPRSEPAIPQLVELLQEGAPDAICEAAAIALGKLAKRQKAPSIRSSFC